MNLSIDLERCPRDHPAALGLIAAIPSGPLIRRILLHLKLAAEPPPLTPVRLEPGRFRLDLCLNSS